MEQFENNKLKIIYNNHRKLGKDIVNIDIENTSFGAMGLFQKDLHELAEKWKLKSIENEHIVVHFYADLLDKLSVNLLEKLKQE